MKKRILSFALALILSLAIIPAALAATVKSTGDVPYEITNVVSHSYIGEGHSLVLTDDNIVINSDHTSYMYYCDSPTVLTLGGGSYGWREVWAYWDNNVTKDPDFNWDFKYITYGYDNPFSDDPFEMIGDGTTLTINTPGEYAVTLDHPPLEPITIFITVGSGETTAPSTPTPDPVPADPTPVPATPDPAPAADAVNAVSGQALELPKIDKPFAELTAVKWGDKVLEQGADKDYTAREGSTIITLTASFIKSLPAGTQTIAVVFGGDTVEQKIVVPTLTNPRTGDNTVIWLAVALFAAASGVFVAVIRKKKLTP